MIVNADALKIALKKIEKVTGKKPELFNMKLIDGGRLKIDAYSASKGRVYTYVTVEPNANESLYTSCDFSILSNAVSRRNKIDFRLDGNALVIEEGKFKAKIDCSYVALIPSLEMPKKFKTLTDLEFEQFSSVSLTALGNTTIQANNGVVASSDTVYAAIAKIALKEKFSIPSEYLKTVKALFDKDEIKWAATEYQLVIRSRDTVLLLPAVSVEGPSLDEIAGLFETQIGETLFKFSSKTAPLASFLRSTKEIPHFSIFPEKKSIKLTVEVPGYAVEEQFECDKLTIVKEGAITVNSTNLLEAFSRAGDRATVIVTDKTIYVSGDNMDTVIMGRSE